MGQATTVHSTRRLCHTHEIAHEPQANEWMSLGQWTSEVEDPSLGLSGDCRTAVSAAWGATCCAGEESGQRAVEEVLVVHHDALRKVDFLLRVDELAGPRCELPSVPECVVAAKRAELSRRVGAVGGLADGSDEDESRGFDVESAGAPGDAEDGVSAEQSIPRARRPLPGMQGALVPGPVAQPRCQELPDDDPQWASADATGNLELPELPEVPHPACSPPPSAPGRGPGRSLGGDDAPPEPAQR